MGLALKFHVGIAIPVDRSKPLNIGFFGNDAIAKTRGHETTARDQRQACLFHRFPIESCSREPLGGL